jgi:cation:H+ antiporter
LVVGIAFASAVLVSGLVLLIFSSDKAVEHSVKVASALGISSLMIGLILVSIGTDLPEIANSIISCSSGAGDIDVGDSIGSVLTQITLVLGLIPFLGGRFKVNRKDVLIIGSFEILALTLAISVALTGFTRVKALLLITSWPIFLFIIRKTTSQKIRKKSVTQKETGRHYLLHIIIAGLSFIGVAIGAVAVVQSVIMLSEELLIPEFFISFFILAIGTSLPELVVDLTALRRGEYDIAIGDIIGSCIVDSTVSISIGQLLFPTAVFVEAPQQSLLLALYALIASAIVIVTLSIRRSVDRKTGILFVLLYAFSYVLLYT